MSFATPPYREPGPNQGGYGLSFDTPPYRGPGQKQGGYGLTFDTPPYRVPGPKQRGYCDAVVFPGRKSAFRARALSQNGYGFTLGILIHDFWAGRKPSIFGVWVAPGAPKNIQTYGGRKPRKVTYEKITVVSCKAHSCRSSSPASAHLVPAYKLQANKPVRRDVKQVTAVMPLSWGPGPNQGGYGLSFDTPPYRGPA